MATIEKKIWPEYFTLVKSGRKKFELRVADFRIRDGDMLVLREWDPKKQTYTGRSLRRRARYILKFKLDKFSQKRQIIRKGLYVIGF